MTGKQIIQAWGELEGGSPFPLEQAYSLTEAQLVFKHGMRAVKLAAGLDGEVTDIDYDFFYSRCANYDCPNPVEGMIVGEIKAGVLLTVETGGTPLRVKLCGACARKHG